MVTTVATAAITAAAAGAPVIPWLAVPAGASTGPVLYVSASGNDQADGRSPATAWRTLGRVNREVLAPGTRVLLEGGRSFPGPLFLDSADAGDPAAPVRIASYGTGRATISGVRAAGISVYNTAGVEIRQLRFSGDADAYRSKGGIEFYSDVPDRKLSSIVIAGVEVRGFRHGIMIGGANARSGFRAVTIHGSTVHDNMLTGLLTYGPAFDPAAPAYAHESVRVTRVVAYRNVGDPGELHRNTGSGIVLGSVRGGLIERSRAYANGEACAAPEGPVGIWTYDSSRVVIQRNIASGNRRAGPADGGGFDLDQNVSDSTMQYNVSYGNDGPGYLVYSGRANDAQAGNVVRFNISSGDAMKSGAYGGITVMGRIRDAEIYNNTVVMRPNGAVRSPAVKLGTGLSGVALRNNVFVSEAAGPLVVAPNFGTAAVLLQGNDYFAPAGGWRTKWGSTTYTSLTGWSAATRQEQLGGRLVGLTVDPAFTDAAATLAMTDAADPSQAAALSLTTGSALRGRALPLTTLFGVAVGQRDYFGNPLPAAGEPYDVGAHHRPLTVASTAVRPLSWRLVAARDPVRSTALAWRERAR